MSNTQKRKILYGRTLRELQKQIKFQEQAAYVPISTVKFYEGEKYPLSHATKEIPYRTKESVNSEWRITSYDKA